MAEKKHHTKHILVIRLSAMGDVAMTVPVLRALVIQHPNVKVTVVSRAFFKPFFDGIPNINFFAADVTGKHKGFFGLLKLYKELRKLHIYAVADLHNVLRSKIITFLFLLRGKRTATLDKARTDQKALTSLKNKVFKPVKPVIERHADVFKKLGLPIDMSIPVFPEKHPISVDVLDLAGEKKQTWIGIAPFAQHRRKVYPRDLMQQVINNLAVNPNYTIFLFGGGKHEKEVLDKFATGHDNVIVTVGKIKLRDELNLISHLDLMLSMDSGNAHMAAMLGTKVVTLWGATHPYTGFAPYNQPLEYALVADREKYPLLPTSVYGNKEVEGYEDAMHSILPQSVVAKVNEVLKIK